MNPETKPADVLARELAERAGGKIVRLDYQTPGQFATEASKIILDSTKLRELCAVAEAARKLFQSGGNTISNHGHLSKALAALDGGGK